MERVKRHLRNYFDQTTVHGLSYVVNSNNAVERHLWVGFILACASYAGTLIHRSLIENRSNPTLTLINIVPNAKIPFPRVTVDGGKDWDGFGVFKQAWNRHQPEEGLDEGKVVFCLYPEFPLKTLSNYHDLIRHCHRARGPGLYCKKKLVVLSFNGFNHRLCKPERSLLSECSSKVVPLGGEDHAD